MNALENNNKHRHLAKLVSSAGRVMIVLAFALILVGCNGVIQAVPLAVVAPVLDSESNIADPSAAPKPGEAVTCTTSTVTTTLCSGTETGDAASAAAYNVSLSAYDALAPKPCDKVLTGTLAGVTLEPGVYCLDAAATLTGQLTLNGPVDGIWIFKIGTTSGTGALTVTDFSVVMAGGGQPCNVSWWVAGAATLTDSTFVGTIRAGKTIKITRGTCSGDIFAKAKVTLTDATVTTCKTSDSGVINSQSSPSQSKCNQGVGNGPEGCDPGNSNQGDPSRSNDEKGGVPGDPGRQGGNGK